jgi:hypothetical protein
MSLLSLREALNGLATLLSFLRLEWSAAVRVSEASTVNRID